MLQLKLEGFALINMGARYIMNNAYEANQEFSKIIFDAATQRIIDLVLGKVLDELPDQFDQEFIDEVKNAVSAGANTGISEQFNYIELCTDGKSYVLKFAEMYLKNTLEQAAENLPAGTAKSIVTQVLSIIQKQGISSLLEDDAVEIDLILDDIFQNAINEKTETVVNFAVEKIVEQLPDEFAKKEFTNLFNQIIKNGIKINAAGELDVSALAEQGKDLGMMVADEYLEKALKATVNKMQSGRAKTLVNNFAGLIAAHGINSLFDEQEQEELLEEIKGMAIKEARNLVAGQSIHVVEFAVDFAADKMKERGRGKARSYRNRKIQEYSVELKLNLANSLSSNIEDVFAGNKNLTEAVSDVAKTSVKDTATRFLRNEGTTLVQSGMKKATNKLHVSGRGSRTINKHIDNFGSVASGQLVMSAGNHAQRFLNNEEDFSEAAYGMLSDTAVMSVQTYATQEGAMIASEAINALAKNVMKDVGNKQVKTMTAKALAKYASAEAIAGTATTLIAMGGTIKQFVNGEITKAELLTQLGEQGTAVCLAETYGAIGMALGSVGGPLGMAAGAAIGSMAGYIASNMMYGALLQAFKDAEAAKANYEKIHAFCEQAIRIRSERRRQFEIATKAFLERRQAVIDNSFATINTAFLANDYEAFGRGLEQIAIEFGGDLGEFKNMDTLKEAMSDESFVFEL